MIRMKSLFDSSLRLVFPGRVPSQMLKGILKRIELELRTRALSIQAVAPGV